MKTLIPYLIAATSTIAFIILWFRVVRNELSQKANMVEVARNQLIASQNEYARVRGSADDFKAKEILKISQSVYRQSVSIYNKALRKPWNAIPALILVYRQEKTNYIEEDQL